MGGTMPDIKILIEYQAPDGIKVIDPFAGMEGGNAGTWISKIREIHSTSGHTYYLIISGAVGDGRHVGEVADAYEIQGNNLNTKVPLFKTKKESLSEISYSSSRETQDRNRFKLSKDGRTFLVPLAIYKTKADKEQYFATLTRKSLKYEFDGEHFVYHGVTK